ncbi:MAG: hypothetical protein HY367_03755 [Candidatus Aenigmarchaeota archaeon]|nr:hypothetical protein [Candidatus Aenigmarchaeota archaeon]
MAKRVIIRETETSNTYGPYSQDVSATFFAVIAGKKVAYFTSTNISRDGVYTGVIVEGVVVSGQYRTEDCKLAVDVEPITGPKFKSKVIKELGREGTVNIF